MTLLNYDSTRFPIIFSLNPLYAMAQAPRDKRYQHYNVKNMANAKLSLPRILW